MIFTNLKYFSKHHHVFAVGVVVLEDGVFLTAAVQSGKSRPASVSNSRRLTRCAVLMFKTAIVGDPNPSRICTSYIERANLTVRTHCKRLARLTLAFSKKLENFKAAIALHLAYYNFVKTHGSLRCTPAMEAGIANSAWSVADLVDASS